MTMIKLYMQVLKNRELLKSSEWGEDMIKNGFRKTNLAVRGILDCRRKIVEANR